MRLSMWQLAVVVLAVAAALVGAGALAQQQEAPTPKEVADQLARHYRIGNRPAVITAEEVTEWIVHFPDFGEATIEALKDAAPINSIAQLTSLRTSSGRALLSEKQVVLLLMLYNLRR